MWLFDNPRGHLVKYNHCEKVLFPGNYWNTVICEYQLINLTGFQSMKNMELIIAILANEHDNAY